MFKPWRCKSFFSNQQLPSASSWTYLTEKKKSNRLSWYPDIPVKDLFTDLIASILDKIFKTPTTKRLKMKILFSQVGKITPLSKPY